MATFLGLLPSAATSSSVVKASSPPRPGSSPSRSGYFSGAGISPPAAVWEIQATNRAQRPPRVEGAEDVAEQHADRHEAGPEHHEHELRGEVGHRHLHAAEAGVDDQPEQGDADQRRRARRSRGW